MSWRDTIRHDLQPRLVALLELPLAGAEKEGRSVTCARERTTRICSSSRSIAGARRRGPPRRRCSGKTQEELYSAGQRISTVTRSTRIGRPIDPPSGKGSLDGPPGVTSRSFWTVRLGRSPGPIGGWSRPARSSGIRTETPCGNPWSRSRTRSPTSLDSSSSSLRRRSRSIANASRVSALGPPTPFWRTHPKSHENDANDSSLLAGCGTSHSTGTSSGCMT